MPYFKIMWWRIVFTHSSKIKDSVSSCKKWNVSRKSSTDSQKDLKFWNKNVKNSLFAHIFNCYKWIDFDVITCKTVLHACGVSSHKCNCQPDVEILTCSM